MKNSGARNDRRLFQPTIQCGACYDVVPIISLAVEIRWEFAIEAHDVHVARGIAARGPSISTEEVTGGRTGTGCAHPGEHAEYLVDSVVEVHYIGGDVEVGQIAGRDSAEPGLAVGPRVGRRGCLKPIGVAARETRCLKPLRPSPCRMRIKVLSRAAGRKRSSVCANLPGQVASERLRKASWFKHK